MLLLKGGSACNLLSQPGWCSSSGWGFKWPMTHGFRSVPAKVLLFYTNRKDKLGSVFCFVHNAISLWTPDTKTDQHEFWNVVRSLFSTGGDYIHTLHMSKLCLDVPIPTSVASDQISPSIFAYSEYLRSFNLWFAVWSSHPVELDKLLQMSLHVLYKTPLLVHTEQTGLQYCWELRLLKWV